jgi:hypothetical protein
MAGLRFVLDHRCNPGRCRHDNRRGDGGLRQQRATDALARGTHSQSPGSAAVA